MSASRPPDLMQHLQGGAGLPMDGAMGTELERRGVAVDGDGWSALALRDRGEVIREIHTDYLRAGARLHIVNSFALARHVLEPLGLGDDFARFNREAVRCFDDAVAQLEIDRASVWAAGSLSTFAAWSDRARLPRGDALIANYRDQARVLHAAGVDLFAFEMLFDVETSLAMWSAVEDLGLPVIFGFTCDRGDDGHGDAVLLRGMGCAVAPLDEVLRQVIGGIDTDRAILSIMHSDIEVTDAALGTLRRHWDGPIAIYPNSGEFVDLHLQFDSVCPAQAFSRAARRWSEAGIQIVGGCCGIGPEHIRAFTAHSAPTTGNIATDPANGT